MAGTGNGSSLSDLERQAEASRAELAHTVDELHSRVSPDALKRDARNYARQTGQQFMQNIETRARENPLAAVAVAAGLALPLWRMVSKLPAPVLLIGAGLALSRRGSSQPDYRRQSMGHAGPGMGERMSDMASDLGEKATNLMEDTQYRASMAGSRVKDAISGTAESARTMAHDAAATVSETTSDMTRRASEGVTRMRTSLADTVERYPLLAGGVAFAVGTLVASALPVTRQENRLLGSASDRLKDRAKEGLDTVKDAAGEVYEETAAQVRELGLNPDTARHAVRTAMNRAGSLAEEATGSAGASSGSIEPRGSRRSKTSNLENDNG